MAENKSPLHPEIEELFPDLLTNLMEESDRGAVLVGASHIDQYLKKLFEAVAPSELGKKQRKSLLDYPGPLSSFAARTEVAYATRLIDQNLYRALHSLRRIRNDVAHHPTTFRLREQTDRIREMYKLGPGMPAAINSTAFDLMMRIKIDHALELKHPGEERPYFNTPQEVVQYIRDAPDVARNLIEQLPRYELAVGLVIMCDLLVWHREAACRLVGKSGSLATLGQAKSDPNEERNPDEVVSKQANTADP